MIRRVYALLALSLSLLLLLSACSPIVEQPAEETVIYTTFRPVYALVSMLTEDIPNLRLNCLADPQVGCMRAYTMSDRDAALLTASAQGVIAFGSGFESFTDSLESLSESAFWLAELLPGQTLYTNDAKAEDEEDHFSGGIPYLYMSSEGGMALVREIGGILAMMDETHAEQYNRRCEDVLASLTSLQDDIKVMTEPCQGVRVAILNEALFYCAEEYGMEIVKVLRRESGELFYGEDLSDCLATLKNSSVEAVLIESHAPLALTDAIEAEGIKVIRLNTLALTNDYMKALRENAEEAARVCAKTEENS